MNLSRMNRRSASAGVTFGDVHYFPGGTCGPRRQGDLQLVVLLDGSVRVNIEGTEHPLEPDEAILLLPGHEEYFAFAAHAESRHLWCALQPELVPPELRAQLAALNTPFTFPGRLRPLLEYGLALEAGADPEHEAVFAGLGLLILRGLLAERRAETARERLPTPLARASAHIADHLGEPLSLVILARVAGVTPQHLTRLFRRHVSSTPMRYLWNLRVERGAALLRETGLSVSAIADQLGFGSPFHFSRLVRQRYGKAPRALRQAAWQSGAPNEE